MIRKAEKKDITSISSSYSELFNYEAVHGSNTNWVDGLYPTKDTAEHAFAKNMLYVLEVEDTICGSMILNRLQPNEYQQINWQYPVQNQEVLVIHTLCICPSHAGKGYGKQMVSYALEEARRLGCKVVRLDTWEGNRPAASLYKSMGFRPAGSAPICLHGLIHEQQIFMECEVKHND